MPNPPAGAPALTPESLGHLAYLHRVLTGGPNAASSAATAVPDLQSWDGFYTPLADGMNFGLRFQLAFAGYAVAALGLHTPAYLRPTVAALGAAIERMRDVRAWGYWRPPVPGPEGTSGGGHVALLVGGHRRATGPPPPPGDPVVQDNVQFSGHLGTLLGLYERAGGDGRYDAGFVLDDPESGAHYEYTHSAVIERLVAQMRGNPFHGVACEPACAYVPCNNHAMTATALHDATHGTAYAAANADWLAWVRGRMVLHGPAARGLFGACYLRDLHLTAPVAFQFTDSWGLAFLLPFDRALVRRLYPRFRKRMSRAGAVRYVGSAPICAKMEISDVALNTAFGLIVARGLGDAATAAGMAAYAQTTFNRRWNGPELYYAGAPRTLHSTALYALADVTDPASDLLTRLFHAPRDPVLDRQPLLDCVTTGDPAAPPELRPPAPHCAIAAAAYDPAMHTLTLATQPLGDTPPAGPVWLDCARVPVVGALTCDGAPYPYWTHDPATGRLHIQAAGDQAQRFAVLIG